VVDRERFRLRRFESSAGAPLTQQYAWFWDKGQKLPHVISDNVYAEINNQVKSAASSSSRRPERRALLHATSPARRARGGDDGAGRYRLVPGELPWHTVIELSREQKRVSIQKGEPLCRVIPCGATPTSRGDVAGSASIDFFARGQQWLRDARAGAARGERGHHADVRAPAGEVEVSWWMGGAAAPRDSTDGRRPPTRSRK
jgi:hypothetical protein